MAIQLDNCGKPIVSSGIGQTQQFRVAATSKTFKLLADGLYSRKVFAILRELSTNAYDAHVAANKKDVPFDVQLPTRLMPEFRIRDYGIGLSHEDVMNLYTTFFESGNYKLKSNDYVGCFGLGSKSPYCYAETFTVVSYFNGVKSVYAAHKDSGIPAISHMMDEPTTEENGLEVVIPTSLNDIQEFHSCARELYQYFACRPRFIGTDLHLEDTQKVVEGSCWYLRANDGHDGARAIVGNISYPISQYTFNDYSIRELLSLNIDIRFDIGDLNPTASREQLEYDKHTINNINEKIKIVLVEAGEKASKLLEDCKTLWEARCKARELMSYESQINKLLRIGSKAALKWQDKPVPLSHEISVSSLCVKADPKGNKIAPRLEMWTFNYKGVYRSNCRRAQKHEVVTLEVNKDVALYEADIANGVFRRCTYALEHGKKGIYLVKFADAKAKQEFCDFLGMDPNVIQKVSSLEKPPRNARGSGPGTTIAKVFTYNKPYNYGADREYSWWKETEIDAEDSEGVYVEMFRHKVVKNGDMVSPTNIESEFNTAKALFGDFDLYGVRKSIADTFRESDDWVDLWTYIKTKLEIAFVQNGVGEHFANVKELKSIALIEQLLTWVKHTEDSSFEHEDSVCGTYIQQIREMAESYKVVNNTKLEQYTSLAKVVGYDLSTWTPAYDLSDVVATLFERYPLLKYMMAKDRYYGHTIKDREDVEDATSYVNLVDMAEDFVLTTA